MTAKKSFIQNFTQPSYMNESGNAYTGVEDTTTDPIFKVTSKKPYRPEISTRSTVWDLCDDALCEIDYGCCVACHYLLRWVVSG